MGTNTKSFKLTDVLLGSNSSLTFKGLSTLASSFTKSWLTPNVTLAPCKGVLVFLSWSLPVIVYSCKIGVWLFIFSFNADISSLILFWVFSTSFVKFAFLCSIFSFLLNLLFCLFSLLCSLVKLEPKDKFISFSDAFSKAERSILYLVDNSWILLSISAIGNASPNKDLPWGVASDCWTSCKRASSPIILILQF